MLKCEGVNSMQVSCHSRQWCQQQLHAISMKLSVPACHRAIEILSACRHSVLRRCPPGTWGAEGCCCPFNSDFCLCLATKGKSNLNARLAACCSQHDLLLPAQRLPAGFSMAFLSGVPLVMQTEAAWAQHVKGAKAPALVFFKGPGTEPTVLSGHKLNIEAAIQEHQWQVCALPGAK